MINLLKIKHNQKFKKAFTLIEMLVVIVIIGILMGSTMKFGGDRIGFLNNKNLKEQFMSNYDNLYSDNMMTNYYQGKPYNDLNILFALESTGLDYIYKGYDFTISDTMDVDGGNYEVLDLSVNGKQVENLDIKLEPYLLGCEINGEIEQLASIDIRVNNNKNYCFEINSDICRIYSVSCD